MFCCGTQDIAIVATNALSSTTSPTCRFLGCARKGSIFHTQTGLWFLLYILNSLRWIHRFVLWGFSVWFLHAFFVVLVVVKDTLLMFYVQQYITFKCKTCIPRMAYGMVNFGKYNTCTPSNQNLYSRGQCVNANMLERKLALFAQISIKVRGRSKDTHAQISHELPLLRLPMVASWVTHFAEEPGLQKGCVYLIHKCASVSGPKKEQAAGARIVVSEPRHSIHKGPLHIYIYMYINDIYIYTIYMTYIYINDIYIYIFNMIYIYDKIWYTYIYIL